MYLKDTVSKFKLRDTVNKVLENPVSLSVNVKLQTQTQRSSSLTRNLQESRPLEGPVQVMEENPLKREQVNFEAAMNEFISENNSFLTSSPVNTTSRQSSSLNQVSSDDDANNSNDEVTPTTKSLQVSSPRMTRSLIFQRTRQLVKSLSDSCSSSNNMRKVVCLQELSKHIVMFPEAAAPSVKEGAIPLMLRMRESSQDRVVQAQCRQALTLLGYFDPPKARGIRILSIDGGGIRGVVILEVLKRLEMLTGQPVYKMFDLICGVSTGAILAMLLGPLKKDLNSCDDMYRMISKKLFVSDFLRGTSRLLLTHAYYDSQVWEKILKEVYSEDKTLIETSLQPDVPKVMAISASLTSPRLKPFVFRNFNLHPLDSNGVYEGSCRHKVWQSVRASTSAPGYFEDFVLEDHVHSDGGILINNPSAIAIHEAQCIWPGERIQCIVSIGTGKYSPPTLKVFDEDSKDTPSKATPASLRAKITSLIDSATDTEITHRLLQDLLPSGTYFRMNPTLSEWMGLDENRDEKLDQLRMDAQMYVRKNELKMIHAANAISQERSLTQISKDYLDLKYKLLFR